MYKQANKLNKISGYFFFLGFFISKFKILPFLYTELIFSLAATTLYLTGYLFWLIANIIHPDIQKHERWYGFLPFKQQSSLSAITGIVASLLIFATLFLPVLIIPVTWLFLISNTIWCIAEFHKLKNPPVEDNQYNAHKQKIYCNYALSTTAISLITAVATTIIIFFPPAALLTMSIAVAACAFLSIVALKFWLQPHFITEKSHSYQTITQQLGIKKQQGQTCEPQLANTAKEQQVNKSALSFLKQKNHQPLNNKEKIQFDVSACLSKRLSV